MNGWIDGLKKEWIFQTNSELFPLKFDPRLVLDCLDLLWTNSLYFSHQTFPGPSESPLDLFTSTLRDFLQGLEVPKQARKSHSLHPATGPGLHCSQLCPAITFQDFLGPQALSWTMSSVTNLAAPALPYLKGSVRNVTLQSPGLIQELLYRKERLSGRVCKALVWI